MAVNKGLDCKNELANIKGIFDEAFGQSKFLQTLNESLEQKTFSGKCYLCSYQVILNLKQHLFYRHNLNFKSAADKNQCLKCGLECLSYKYLVVHYYMAHNLVVLTSLNKAFRVNEVLQPRIDLNQANLMPIQPTLSNTLFYHSTNKELATKTDIFYYNNKQMLNLNSFKSAVKRRFSTTDENTHGCFRVRTTHDGDELMEIDLDEPQDDHLTNGHPKRLNNQISQEPIKTTSNQESVNSVVTIDNSVPSSNHPVTMETTPSDLNLCDDCSESDTRTKCQLCELMFTDMAELASHLKSHVVPCRVSIKMLSGDLYR